MEIKNKTIGLVIILFFIIFSMLLMSEPNDSPPSKKSITPLDPEPFEEPQSLDLQESQSLDLQEPQSLDKIKSVFLPQSLDIPEPEPFYLEEPRSFTLPELRRVVKTNGLRYATGNVQSCTRKAIGNAQIYWINMAKSKRRAEKMREEFEKYGIAGQTHRVEAVDGGHNEIARLTTEACMKKLQEQPEQPWIDDPTWKEWTKALTTRIIAVTMSHVKAIKIAYKDYMLALQKNDGEASPFALIMEDDVSFQLLPLWLQSLKDFVQSAPHDWGAINIGCINWRDKNAYIASKGKAMVPMDRKKYSLDAYIVNLKSDAVFSLIGNDNLAFDTCHVAEYVIYIHLLKTYVSTMPMILPQNDEPGMGTVIGSRHEKTAGMKTDKKHILWITDGFKTWVKLHQELHRKSDEAVKTVCAS